MLNKEKNLQPHFYDENSETEYEDDYLEDEEFLEISNDELEYINENYPGKYIENTIKISKAPRPISFETLKNIKYTPTKLEYLPTKLEYLKIFNTPNKKPNIKKIKKVIENNKTWNVVKKEINNKIKDVCFMENEFPILESGNEKIKIQEYKKEADSWTYIPEKKKKKNNVIDISNNLKKEDSKKDIINKCHFDKDCRNVKRINENQYINKDTNIKCKYLHSGETIENYNYRINDRDIKLKDIIIPEKIKNIVVPILKVFSKIENPWCFKNISPVLPLIAEQEKKIFIKAPKSLETHILNMGKKNEYNIKLSLY